MKEMVGGCCVCSDDRGWSENPLVYCDGVSCTVAVHQACYGIVTVPPGNWYCRKCESQERSVKVKCELCPSKYGALKRTDNAGWAHVVCALYIPEVRFGNVTTMEPIQLQLIPAERFNKLCYICEENGKPQNASVGACMQCNKTGCKQTFHVTCAQALGLLCEEAGNYLDNVKYCGYCQHHYGKLRKSGNLKTVPPYKPVSTENHHSDSSSEKEPDPNSTKPSTTAASSSTSTSQQPVSSTSSSSTSSSAKRKSSSSSSSSTSNKTSSSTSKTANSSSKTSSASTSSSSSSQKTVHSSSSKNTDKPKLNSSGGSVSKSAKSAADEDRTLAADSEAVVVKTDKAAVKESKEGGESGEQTKEPVKSSSSSSSKKRKANSRTPTPVSVVVVSGEGGANAQASPAAAVENSAAVPVVVSVEKKDTVGGDNSEKHKKPRTETSLQSSAASQSAVALSSSAALKSSSPLTTVPDTPGIGSSTSPTSSIIQSVPTQQPQSLVVSVPLLNTNLSPRAHIPNNTQITNVSTIVNPAAPFAHLSQERIHTNSGSERSTPNNISMTGGSANQSGVITTEMSGGGLKITYEKQQQPVANSSLQMELERITPTPTEQPAKRSRSHSSEKSDRSSRARKRSSNNINNNHFSSNSAPATSSKRNSNRSQQLSPPSQSQPPQQMQQQPQQQHHSPGAFAAVTQIQIKDSPPSSPSSESQSSATTAPPVGRRVKGRKSAPASTSNTRDSKDNIKLFQNGMHAPHMLGNQLNPNSNMAQKMSDHLNSELEAHSIFNPSENSSSLIGPQLHHRVIAQARASSTGSASSNSGGLSSMLGGNSGSIPQTLDQLLERQWEQGSQFLMEQAQHFDIASLLSCLHQLRAENLRLEEHVSSLLQRRDHLLAVNARLAIPLTGQPAIQQSHPHTVNNIHPAVVNSHGDLARPSRHSNNYPPQNQAGASAASSAAAATPAVVENGVSSDSSQNFQYSSRRSPAVSQPQPSPTIRHSPAGSGFPNSGLIRQSADTSGRSAPRPQPYPLYQGPGPSSQSQQVVVRRDSDVHQQQPSSKPS